jgi:hypothetical protein
LGTQDVDALWSHDFKWGKGKEDDARVISLGISAFDVLNHPNFTKYEGNARSSLFMQPTVAMPGRQLQFSFGFRFQGGQAVTLESACKRKSKPGPNKGQLR